MKKLQAIVSYEKGNREKFVLYGQGFNDEDDVRMRSEVDVGRIEWTVHQPTKAQKDGTRLKFFATPVHNENENSKSGMTRGDVLGDLNVTVIFADGTSSETLYVSNVAFLDP